MTCISRQNIGKYTYLYESVSFRDQNGRPRNKKVSIGKIDPVTGMPVFKKEYLERMAAAGTPIEQEAPSIPRESLEIARNILVSNKRYGSMCLFLKLANSINLLPLLQNAFSMQFREIFTLACFLVKSQEPLLYCEEWLSQTESMHLVAQTTGESFKVYLFVGTLPYSQYSYVEPCLDCKESTWLRCHFHMYEFFGGVPRRTICDNLKTGVIKHPREGEIVLNEKYEALADHYLTAIMPAPVKKPKAKESVEGTVGKLATAVIAKLRNETFFDFNTLKNAVRKALAEFNKSSFQKRPGSRYELWLDEKAYFEMLPDIPFELAEWLYGRKVYPNCHVSVKKNFYSVPYKYVGQKVDVKLLDNILEIYCSYQCIARHRRYPESIQGNTLPDRKTCHHILISQK